MSQSDKDSDTTVSLREVTADTVRDVCRLSVRDDQTGFVAPNAVSIAQAYFSDIAWFRAVYADDEPVGFAMLWADTKKPEYFLWRFMIDQRYQGKGYGREAMELIINHVKTLPKATIFETSVVQKPGGPQQFYEKLGFVLTGEYEDGEAMMRLKLS
jgi:diamine N-acetyltransferase